MTRFEARTAAVENNIAELVHLVRALVPAHSDSSTYAVIASVEADLKQA